MLNPAETRRQAAPNVTFALLVGTSAAVIAVITWSTHHLLMVGAPVTVLGAWPGVQCLLVPESGDVGTHVISYAFLLAIVAGLTRGGWVVRRQRRQTSALLQVCHARPAEMTADAAHVVEQLGLNGRVDVVDIPLALAFCHGYARPRMIVSSGLLKCLALEELRALLLHEREHLRQLDPLKVAVGRLLASSVFFVPVLSGLYRRFLTEKEIAADRAAIVSLGSTEALVSALVRLIDLQPTPRPDVLVGADEALDARIDVLMGETTHARSRFSPESVLRSIVVGFMAILPLVLAPPPAAASFVDHAALPGCHTARPGEGAAR